MSLHKFHSTLENGSFILKLPNLTDRYSTIQETVFSYEMQGFISVITNCTFPTKTVYTVLIRHIVTTVPNQRNIRLEHFIHKEPCPFIAHLSATS